MRLPRPSPTSPGVLSQLSSVSSYKSPAAGGREAAEEEEEEEGELADGAAEALRMAAAEGLTLERSEHNVTCFKGLRRSGQSFMVIGSPSLGRFDTAEEAALARARAETAAAVEEVEDEEEVVEEAAEEAAAAAVEEEEEEEEEDRAERGNARDT